MKPYSWQLQEAKNKLSALVADAVEKGPQTITVRGKDKVVVISVEEYQRLAGKKGSLLDVLRSAPLAELNLERDKDTGRDIEL